MGNKIGKKDHVVFILATFMYWSSQYLYTPILSPYLEYRGASNLIIGSILSSYGVTQLFLRLPLGILSDYLKIRKPFIMFGMLTSLISGIVLAVTEQLGWALASRAIAGISASTWVAFTVLYSSYFSSENVTKAMSNIQFVTVTAQLIGMGVSGYLASKGGWLLPFWMAVLVAVIGFVLSLLIKDNYQSSFREPIKSQDLVRAMKDPILLKVSLLSIIAHGILFITMYGFTPLQALKIGANKGEIGWLVLSFMLPHAIASFMAGRYFVIKLGQWKTLILGFLGSAIFTIMIPFAKSLVELCLTQVANGFALGLTFPLFLGMAIQHMEREKRATAMGFYQAVYSFGIFLGPFIAGWLNTDHGLDNGFIFAGLSALLATGLSIYWGSIEQRLLLFRTSLDKKA